MKNNDQPQFNTPNCFADCLTEVIQLL